MKVLAAPMTKTNNYFDYCKRTTVDAPLLFCRECNRDAVYRYCHGLYKKAHNSPLDIEKFNMWWAIKRRDSTHNNKVEL